MLSYPGEANNS